MASTYYVGRRKWRACGSSPLYWYFLELPSTGSGYLYLAENFFVLWLIVINQWRKAGYRIGGFVAQQGYNPRFDIFGLLITKSNPGEISPNPVWVCIDTHGYMYIEANLLRLFITVLTQWRQDRHIVG